MANRWENNGNSERHYFWGAPKSLQMMTAAMKLKYACLFEERYDKPSNIFKSRDITLLKKFSIIKAMIFPAVMYGCDS